MHSWRQWPSSSHQPQTVPQLGVGLHDSLHIHDGFQSGLDYVCSHSSWESLCASSLSCLENAGFCGCSFSLTPIISLPALPGRVLNLEEREVIPMSRLQLSIDALIFLHCLFESSPTSPSLSSVVELVIFGLALSFSIFYVLLDWYLYIQEQGKGMNK